MTKKLLIDAHQPEETRVVLLNGNKIEAFDYENTNFQQIKGNVYLARVTRVEPSLQAAFVEYGGHKQGFLGFSEIHPDYYRIPIEDREALLAASQRAEAEREDDEPDDNGGDDSGDNGGDNGGDNSGDNHSPEIIGGDEQDEDIARPKTAEALVHKYKIQEVITRKQILLVQVTKEERGHKGASLTTYLSLAGRYCVLMPNSHKGGGVSRKISHVADRKRLKTIMSDLDVPKNMAVIVRTAGAKRTKADIKRDYAYLTKLWDDIRAKTLQSEAPMMIHEEGSLVKRAIRDIYTNDVEEVLIEGEAAYQSAKAHMKMLIPSHAKKLIQHEGDSHLYQAYDIEPQIDSIHQSEVKLKSGGSLVMNQTEALVAIDVNSGKSTRERNVEETAIKTNLEAAEEVGRQLRLRDLAGLIVIDFIDMEEYRNKQSVERKLRDALRQDKARIQMGSISHFGLLEMSRQRLRPSLVESVSLACPHCQGSGRVRSVNSSALHILRLIEEEAAKQAGPVFTICVHPDIALYILNQKRASLAMLEERFSLSIFIEADASLLPDEYRTGDRRHGRPRSGKPHKSSRPRSDEGDKRRDKRNNGRRRKRRPFDEDEARTDEPRIDDEDGGSEMGGETSEGGAEAKETKPHRAHGGRPKRRSSMRRRPAPKRERTDMSGTSETGEAASPASSGAHADSPSSVHADSPVHVSSSASTGAPSSAPSSAPPSSARTHESPQQNVKIVTQDSNLDPSEKKQGWWSR